MEPEPIHSRLDCLTKPPKKKEDKEEASAAAALKRPVPETWQMGTEAFNHRMPHHDGIKALWETKWRVPCSKGLYPFHDGSLEDFEPIFRDLIARDINDGTSPAYSGAFFATANRLESAADKIMACAAADSVLRKKPSKPLLHPAPGDTPKKEDPRKRVASEFYLRAACVLRIARFPYIAFLPEGPTDPVKWSAWEWQKKVYMKAASSWPVPITEVMIPHMHRSGRDREFVPAYVRVPNFEKEGGHPTVLLLTGLDGYRPDNTGRCDEFLKRKWATVVVEIPGTADCPADPADPDSPDRLWDSVLDWMRNDHRFDMNRVMVWGLSAGGYYAIRIAHTHRYRLAGVVAQGAGSHHFFAREWLEKADGHEYPFKLLPALAQKHGFGSVEEYLEGAKSKFSLLEAGILSKACTRLLLVNVSLTVHPMS